jgi:hypothetical protein
LCALFALGNEEKAADAIPDNSAVIKAYAEQLIIPEIKLDGVSLKTAVKTIKRLSREACPQGMGVSFFLQLGAPSPPAESDGADPFAGGGDDPFAIGGGEDPFAVDGGGADPFSAPVSSGGDPFAGDDDPFGSFEEPPPAPPLPYVDGMPSVSLHLKQMPLSEVLRYLTLQTGTVFDYGSVAIVISQAGNPAAEVEPRVYYFPQSLLHGWAGIDDGNVSAVLGLAGVEVYDSSQVDYNERTEKLLLSTTPEEFADLERFLEVAAPDGNPTQVGIAAELVEIGDSGYVKGIPLAHLDGRYLAGIPAPYRKSLARTNLVLDWESSGEIELAEGDAPELEPGVSLSCTVSRMEDSDLVDLELFWNRRSKVGVFGRQLLRQDYWTRTVLRFGYPVAIAVEKGGTKGESQQFLILEARKLDPNGVAAATTGELPPLPFDKARTRYENLLHRAWLLDQQEWLRRSRAEAAYRDVLSSRAPLHLRTEAGARLAVVLARQGKSEGAERLWRELPGRETLPEVVSAWAERWFGTEPARRETLALTGHQEKLDNLIIPRASFEDMAPRAAFEEFVRESRKVDPEGQGINLVFLAPQLRAEFDEEFGTTATMDFERIPVREAVRYLCMQLGLRFRIEPHAVVIYDEGQRIEPLETLIVPTDAEFLSASLGPGDGLGIGDDPGLELRYAFENFGVDFSSDARIAHHEPTQLLVVRDTAEVLRNVGRLMKSGCNMPAAQIYVSCELIRADESVARELGERVLIGDEPIDGADRLRQYAGRWRSLGTIGGLTQSMGQCFTSRKVIARNGTDPDKQLMSMTVTPELLGDQYTMRLHLEWQALVKGRELSLNTVCKKRDGNVVVLPLAHDGNSGSDRYMLVLRSHVMHPRGVAVREVED